MNGSDHFKLKVIPSAYDFLPYGKYKICFGETLKGIQEDNEILYIMNNCGHRSDDFIKNHDGLHILFAGCSVTFGEGLPYMSNWSGKLYNKISKQIKTSGYFSLSFLGGDTTLIIANIYKYIAFNRVIMPIAYQFNPQLVLVAAGFDSARGDPIGGE